MTHLQKLDKTLRKLYEYKFDGHYHKIEEVLAQAEVPYDGNEARHIAKRLHESGYVKMRSHKSGTDVCIVSKGVEYCEASSFTQPGTAIINITNINSPGASITTGDNVIGSTINTSAAKELIDIIKDQLQRSAADQAIISEIGACMDDIVAEVQQGKPANKFTLKGLLSTTADLTTVYPKMQEFAHIITTLLP